MNDRSVRVQRIKIDARFVEPKYGAALVTLVKDGIEIEVSVPLSQGDGMPGGFDQIEQFFRDAADATVVFIKSRSGKAE